MSWESFRVILCVYKLCGVHMLEQSYSHYGELFEEAWQPFTKQPRLRISDFAGQRVSDVLYKHVYTATVRKHVTQVHTCGHTHACMYAQIQC